MNGKKTKVNDIKTQETNKKPIVNHETPPRTNNKVDVDILTFDDLKQLIERYKYIKSKISKLGELVVEVDGDNIFYVAQRKYGLGFQINDVGHWVTQRITTKEQLENKVEVLKKLHTANELLLKARKDLVTG